MRCFPAFTSETRSRQIVWWICQAGLAFYGVALPIVVTGARLVNWGEKTIPNSVLQSSATPGLAAVAIAASWLAARMYRTIRGFGDFIWAGITVGAVSGLLVFFKLPADVDGSFQISRIPSQWALCFVSAVPTAASGFGVWFGLHRFRQPFGPPWRTLAIWVILLIIAILVAIGIHERLLNTFGLISYQDPDVRRTIIEYALSHNLTGPFPLELRWFELVLLGTRFGLLYGVVGGVFEAILACASHPALGSDRL